MTDAYRIRSDETWDQARSDYLGGFSAEEVCRRHDLGLSALRRRARDQGWRRTDQADPAAPSEDDLTVFEDLEPGDLVEMAWRRLAAAVSRGQAVEAARWLRIHADLHARAQAEIVERARDAVHDAHMATLAPDDHWTRQPRLRSDGGIVHDVHSKFSNPGREASEDAFGEPVLSRAERRRAEAEARRRR